MAELLGPIDGAAIKLSQTEVAVGWRVGLLERAALGLMETKDRTSQGESDVAGLRAAMADGSVKFEMVQRKVAGLKVGLSDCCLKVNQDLAKLGHELAKLKEEIRAMSPKPEPLAPPAEDGAVLPARKAAAPA
jgi:hypothetical protein